MSKGQTRQRVLRTVRHAAHQFVAPDADGEIACTLRERQFTAAGYGCAIEDHPGFHWASGGMADKSVIMCRPDRADRRAHVE